MVEPLECIAAPLDLPGTGRILPPATSPFTVRMIASEVLLLSEPIQYNIFETVAFDALAFK